MFNYAIVEISGRQYKVTPGAEIRVDFLGETKDFECKNVLLLATDKGVSVGAPYLKDVLNFEVVKTVKGEKIRVATYKSKANTRKAIGSRNDYSVIKAKS